MLMLVAVAALVVFGGACVAGKQTGAVPVNIEAPDTATADRGSAASTGWFNVQSIGGSVGLVVMSIAFMAFMAWALTKLYNRFVCRYPTACNISHGKEV